MPRLPIHDDDEDDSKCGLGALMKSRDKRGPWSRRYFSKEPIEIEHATGGADKRSYEQENRQGRTLLLGE
jgi:hypothetical protein